MKKGTEGNGKRRRRKGAIWRGKESERKEGKKRSGKERKRKKGRKGERSKGRKEGQREGGRAKWNEKKCEIGKGDERNDK